jgi:hypothetical protein
MFNRWGENNYAAFRQLSIPQQLIVLEEVNDYVGQAVQTGTVSRYWQGQAVFPVNYTHIADPVDNDAEMGGAEVEEVYTYGDQATPRNKRGAPNLPERAALEANINRENFMRNYTALNSTISRMDRRRTELNDINRAMQANDNDELIQIAGDWTDLSQQLYQAYHEGVRLGYIQAMPILDG